MPAAKVYTHDGRTMTLRQWSEEPGPKKLGLSLDTIRKRVELGKSIGEAISQPLGPAKGGRRSTRRGLLPEVAAQVAETIETHVKRAKARRAAESDAVQASETLPALSPAEALTRLGYVVEDAGLVPAGRLLIVRGAA